MKENIDIRKVQNRKIILELRFDNKPILLDKKGFILDSLTELINLKDPFWNIGDSFIKITDSDSRSKERNSLTVEMSKIHYSCSSLHSLDEYFSSFNSFVTLIKEELNIKKVKRIGCRIIGTYNTKSTNFESLLKSFKDNFPSQLFIADFNPSDFLLRVKYSNGSYTVGPINKNDAFLKTNFPFSDRLDNVGIGLDIDSYLLQNDKDDINSIEKIKDVFIASLSVEKSLLERMESF